MATLSSIQSKLQNKVFGKIGSNLVVHALTSSTNKWGDKTVTATTNTKHVAVPYNYFKQSKTFNPFGVANEGEFDLILPYNATIVVGNTVTYDSKTFDVFGVEKFPYSNGNIAFLVRLKEQLA